MRTMLALAAVVLAASPTSAAGKARPSPQMPAGEFLGRAEPLLKKSLAVLVFSGEARALMRALGESAEGQRNRIEADKASGRQSLACPPPRGKARLDGRELLGFIKRLPPAEKARSLDHAVGGYMAWKYPCAGAPKKVS